VNCVCKKENLVERAFAELLEDFCAGLGYVSKPPKKKTLRRKKDAKDKSEKKR